MFANKVVLITGGSSGIGAETSRYLAKLSAKVVLVGRNEERLKEVVDQIKNDNSPEPLAIKADVNTDAERIISETIKNFGKLDVLINNAGIFSEENIENLRMEAFDQMINTNLRSIIQLTQLAIPYLSGTKGNIVNVSSTAGLKPVKNMLSYCLSKAALDQFTKCCALDLASKGIRVNSINPAAIRTPIYRRSLGINNDEEKQLFDEYKNKYPVGRVGIPSDCSAAIAYLASEQASFMTGILLPVDGGAIVAGFD